MNTAVPSSQGKHKCARKTEVFRAPKTSTATIHFAYQVANDIAVCGCTCNTPLKMSDK